MDVQSIAAPMFSVRRANARDLYRKLSLWLWWLLGLVATLAGAVVVTRLFSTGIRATETTMPLLVGVGLACAMSVLLTHRIFRHDMSAGLSLAPLPLVMLNFAVLSALLLFARVYY